jgi:homoserine kinase type II
VAPHCSQAELRNSAVVLAQFHHATRGFEPAGKRLEPKILEMLPAIAKSIAEIGQVSGHVTAWMDKHTAFDETLFNQLDLVQRSLDETYATLSEPACQALPENVVHCDYHPGNLKFEGEAITGLFDFDWSKVDKRSFEGLALWYLFATWEAPRTASCAWRSKGFHRGYQGYLRITGLRAAQPG